MKQQNGSDKGGSEKRQPHPNKNPADKQDTHSSVSIELPGR